MKNVDYLIIGGGIVGVTIAYHLAQDRAGSIVLCERNGLGSGTTAMSGAMCGQQAEINPDITALSQRALSIYTDFEERIGGSCGFFRRGILSLSPSEEQARNRANRAASDGSKAEFINDVDIRKIYPQVETKGREFGVYFPGTGCVDSYLTLHSYAAGASRMGAELHEFTPVEEIRVEGQRIVRIRAGEGLYEPGCVILACGPWSPEVASLAGVHVPITPTMQGIAFFRHPPGAFESPPVLAAELAIIPWYSDLFRVLRDTRDPLIYCSPDPVDAACPQWMIDHAKSVIEHRLPDMRRGRFQGAYRTCYDDTPDLKPLIGYSQAIDNLFLDCGWSGRGFKFSVAIGDLVSKWITGTEPTIDISPWRLERFSA